jgi:RNA polymerase sigma-70 factor (ECF subfamily)
MSPADVTLIERWVNQRDADAFAEIVSQHSGMVYATCLRILRNSADAEEVAQECFLRLATSAENVRSSLGGWLHRAATTRSLDRLRTEKRRLHRDTAYTEALQPTAREEWQDVQEYIDEALASLPDKYQYAVVAHFFEGRTYEALSAGLGISRSAAAYRVQKGIELVRRALARRGVEVMGTALSMWLVAQKAEAAPATLLLPLQKLAVAGVRVYPHIPHAAVVKRVGAKQWTAALASLTAAVALTLTMLLMLRNGAPDYGELSRQNEHSATAVTPEDRQYDEGTSKDVLASPVPPPGTATPAPAASREATANSGTAMVSGRIFDDAGASFSGAQVHLQISRDLFGYDSTAAYSTLTDSSGRYEFEAMPGVATVYAGAPGYLMQQGLSQPLAAGARSENNDLTLFPASYAIEGQVVDKAGHSVPGATVHLLYLGLYDGEFRQSFSVTLTKAFAQTDADGRFALPVPGDGLTDLMATAEAYAPAVFQAVPTRSKDALLVIEKGGSVTGRVTNGDGAPLTGALVQAVGLTSSLEGPTEQEEVYRLPTRSVRTGDDGVYRLDGLSPGYSYTVGVVMADSAVAAAPRDAYFVKPPLASASDLMMASEKSGVYVHSGGAPTTVDLVVHPLAHLRGKVVDRVTKRPVRDLTLQAGYKSGNSGVFRSVITGEDGDYAFSFALNTPTFVTITPYYCSQAIASPGDGPGAVPRVALAPGEERTLDLQADAPVTAPVRLVEKDGTPVSGVRLYLCSYTSSGLPSIPQKDKQTGMDSVTDRDGRYTWYGLKPGQLYRISASDPLKDPTYHEFATTSLFSGEAGEVLPELVLAYQPLGGLSATIMSEEGYALWDKAVTITALHPSTGESVQAQSRTDGEGRFKKTLAFPPGYYAEVTLHLRRGGVPHHAVVEDVTIVRDEITSLGPITVVEDDPAALHDMRF